MKGYFALTDYGWYERLVELPARRDVNFWRPSTHPFSLAIGTPFFFKLKTPRRAIAGFGFFAGFSALPDWLAWDTFREHNGVASLEELRARLTKIGTAGRVPLDPHGQIGCCLIAESVFFKPGEWVDPQTDWSPRIQSGRGEELSVGEGHRIWEQCQLRAQVPTIISDPPQAAKYGEPTVYLPRLGQGIFRVRVLDAYGRACAVTGEHSLPVVEAAHIKPYAQDGNHTIPNGIALRTDLHRLFDCGYATVDSDHRFVVSHRLKDDFQNGHSYYALQGTHLLLPDRPDLRPDQAALEWHREHVFLG